jgi:hypothetical protein
MWRLKSKKGGIEMKDKLNIRFNLINDESDPSPH